ncbi:MAG: hypothetical protein GTO18_17625 [Anaerolineales bacterium]|nr:hypothetical protein [Anaerolineales bacterium]
MDEQVPRGGLAGPIILIGVGIILLLNMTGVLAIDLWDLFISAWPIILIAFGIDLLIPRRTVAGTIISLILIVGVLVGGVWLVETQGGTGTADQVETVTYPLDSTERATMTFSPAVGGVRVSLLEDSQNLLEGQVGLHRGQEVEVETEELGESAAITVTSSGQWFWMPGTLNLEGEGVDEGEWLMLVSPEIPVRLVVDMGAGDIRLDLRGLQLKELKSTMGVGRMQIRLPSEGDFRAVIDGAVGMTEVIVPEGLPVRIQVDTGIATISIQGFQKVGDTYLSSEALTSDEVVELDLSQAIGAIIVREE